MRSFLLALAFVFSCTFTCLSAEEPGEAGEDSSAGLPEPYARDYLIAASTISPDKRFAIIYPTREPEEETAKAASSQRLQDYIVALQPFAILSALETESPYFQNQNHGGISAEWSADSSVALVTLEGKWGPRDVFLLEFRDGKLSRTTNLLEKAHELLRPGYRKAKPKPYNDEVDFILTPYEETVCKLDDTRQVKIDAVGTTDPKEVVRGRWSAHLTAVWDIAQAKFSKQQITRE